MRINTLLPLTLATTLITSITNGLPTEELNGPSSPHCFPFSVSHSWKLSLDLQPPPMSREEWWCAQEDFYGFLGFSMPFQYTNMDYDVESISQHLVMMKEQFGATMFRVYIPESYNTQLWKNILQAAIINNMGVVVQVAFPISGNSLSLEAVLESTLFQVLSDSPYAAIAPYVIFAAEYLNEPVGDCDMCAAGSTGNPADPASLANLTQGLTNFRNKMHQFGIPAGISEDWDRPNLMSGPPNADGVGVGLGVIGEAVAPIIDFCHAHIMAYYHNIQVQDAWNYTASQVLWYKQYLPKLPLLISEMMWATSYNVLHAGGYVTGFAVAEVSVQDYTLFWKTVDANCKYLKEQNTAYFIHAWREEGTLDMLNDDGTVVIPNWKPQKWC
ncbi:hypothetical protein BGW36DRAFT_414093 [Talaromyces proteolyticus]|uniref:Glycoside hydrolase family 17 protein n=1 Tax=Talaromyces proteolyticus TaxID=1131652 RepID=A0AAD4Q2F2_9EURO|nr:uncharacterized protein BGW36DRAFT_414093 [Talaromyces proteolyticus]KAH8703622.1 hypothetical protein BGW36DRAFT_414093 [Talaromyces proteolyticus]